MAQVNFPSDVGGDGSTYSDTTDATTGLAGTGYATKLVPMFAQMINVANWVKGLAVTAADRTGNGGKLTRIKLDASGMEAVDIRTDASGNVGLGITPVSKLELQHNLGPVLGIGSTTVNRTTTALRYLGDYPDAGTGRYAIVLLGRYQDGTATSRVYNVNGVFRLFRGATGATSINAAIDVTFQAAYSSTAARQINRSAPFIQRFKFVRCTYSGIEYIGLTCGLTSQCDIYFEGHAANNQSDTTNQLRVVQDNQVTGLVDFVVTEAFGAAGDLTVTSVGDTVAKNRLVASFDGAVPTAAVAGEIVTRRAADIGTVYFGDSSNCYLHANYGGGNSDYVFGPACARIRPANDNGTALGAAGQRYSVTYSAGGVITTSDAREKTSVRKFTQAELNAAKELASEIGFFQFLASVKEKGADRAREHCGMTVQRAIEILKKHGLNPFRCAFICYDKWEKYEEPARLDEDGNVITPATVSPAGDRYSFRTDQLNLFIVRGVYQVQQEEFAELRARIEKLEGTSASGAC